MRSRKQHFNVREVARMTGMSKVAVINHVRDGRLVAHRIPRGDERNSHYRVYRDDLVRWLLDYRFPVDRLRSVLNPDGAVLLVRADVALECALGGTRTKAVDSLFALGLALTEVPSWALVVDLPASGTEESCRSLAELSRRADRPLLVGLYGDEGCVASPLVPQTFDALFARSAPAEDLARSILRLRPYTPSRDL